MTAVLATAVVLGGLVAAVTVIWIRQRRLRDDVRELRAGIDTSSELRSLRNRVDDLGEQIDPSGERRRRRRRGLYAVAPPVAWAVDQAEQHPVRTGTAMLAAATAGTLGILLLGQDDTRSGSEVAGPATTTPPGHQSADEPSATVIEPGGAASPTVPSGQPSDTNVSASAAGEPPADSTPPGERTTPSGATEPTQAPEGDGDDADGIPPPTASPSPSTPRPPSDEPSPDIPPPSDTPGRTDLCLVALDVEVLLLGVEASMCPLTGLTLGDGTSLESRRAG